MAFGNLGALGRGFGRLGAVLGGAGTSPPPANTLVAGVGSFVLNGEAMTPLVDYKLPSDVGSFTLSGQSAGVLAARTVSAAFGSFAFTGQDATLTYSGSGVAFSVTATDSDSVSTATTANTFTAKNIGTADASRKVFVCIGVRSVTAAASSVTVDGVSATLVDSIGNAGNEGVEIWVANVGSSSGHTTGDVVVNYASAPTRIGISVYTVLGSTSSIVSAKSAVGTTSITAGAITVPTGGSLIAAFFGRCASAPTVTWSGAFSSASDISIQPGANTATLATGHSAPGAATGSQSETATPSLTMVSTGGLVVIGLGP